MKTNGNRANGTRVSHPLPSSRGSIAAPPSGPVRWNVFDRGGKPLGSVLAQTWIVARATAMATYHREAHELRVNLAAEGGAAR
jgi:hypothetical protein